MTLRDRIIYAWRLIVYGELPPAPQTDFTALQTLLGSCWAAATADAVEKVERDPALRTAENGAKFDEAVTWSVHYARDRYHLATKKLSSWQLSFLIEYAVGKLKGKI